MMTSQTSFILVLALGLAVLADAQGPGRPDIRDCQDRRCPALLFCRPDEQPYFDGCCTVCGPRRNCDLVRCPNIECELGSFTPPNSCCPVCRPTFPGRPDCSNVECPRLECESGRTYTNPFSCCPMCRPSIPTLAPRPDCREVVCPRLECEHPIRVPYSCCPICISSITRPTRPITSTRRPGCTRAGQFYEQGDRVPTSHRCQVCFCHVAGRIRCHRQRCPFLRHCRGRIQFMPGQCCPVCSTEN